VQQAQQQKLLLEFLQSAAEAPLPQVQPLLGVLPPLEVLPQVQVGRQVQAALLGLAGAAQGTRCHRRSASAAERRATWVT